MTPEAEFLLALLRQSCPNASPTPAMLRLAESHGLSLLLCNRLQQPMPEEFAQRARNQWTWAAFLASELRSLLQQFSQHGIEVIALKGPAMASLLYGSLGRRACDDLDLLVRPADLPRAKDLLTGLGFSAVGQPADYHHSFLRGSLLVELHFALSPPSNPSINLETAWARARTIDFKALQTRFLAPPDLLLYLVIHLVKHDFGRLIWLLDASLALRELTPGEVQEVLSTARTIGIEGALLTTCALIESLCQQTLPPMLEAALARKPMVGLQAQGIRERLLKEPSNAVTAHQGAQTFIQLEPDSSARWAQRLRGFKPSQQDHLWAAKHHLSPRWMLLIRPLRLIAKHGVAAAWRVLFPRSGVSTLQT